MEYTGKELVTAPTEEPITLAEAKLFARTLSADTSEDSLLEGLITTVREFTERVTRRALITQEWKIFLNTFPGGASIELPFAPLQDVTHVKYYNEQGVLTTLVGNEGGDGAIAEIVTSSEPGKIRLAPEQNWPATQLDRFDAVEVQFVAGYADAASVPASLKSIMLALLVHLYENRGETDLSVFEKLLMGHRVWSIF